MKDKISLIKAIIININIMIGAGIFMNAAPLTRLTGNFGFTLYFIGGLFLLPIVITIAKLAKKNPIAGGLYVYNKNILGSFSGFLGGWSYFLGKATSAAVLCNTFVVFFHSRIKVLNKFPVIFLDLILIFILIFINIFGLKIGGKIQYAFASAKFIPIIFVAFLSISAFNPSLFLFKANDYKNILNIFEALPIAIFALLSFEIITSIGHLIKKPQKNIQRTVLYSFFIVVFVATIFQLTIFGSTGMELGFVKMPILLWGTKIFQQNSIIPILINSLVFASVLGGAFGSLTSNCWNFYAFSKDKQIPFSKFFTKINKNNVPYTSLLLEGILAFIILAISREQMALQNMTVLGIVTAYFFSSISLFKISIKEKSNAKFISILSILSSSYLIIICIKNITKFGASLPFIFIFLIGIILFIKNKKYYLT